MAGDKSSGDKPDSGSAAGTDKVIKASGTGASHGEPASMSAAVAPDEQDQTGDETVRAVRNENEPADTNQMRKKAPRQPRDRQKQGFLDRTLQARIGTILRDSYSDIEQEPLPDRLQELIKALQDREKNP
jgi:hypothetical protein